MNSFLLPVNEGNKHLLRNSQSLAISPAVSMQKLGSEKSGKGCFLKSSQSIILQLLFIVD